MAKTGEDGSLSPEQLAQALEKGARKAAKKMIRKAFGIAKGTKTVDGIKAHFDGIIKAALADRVTKDELIKSQESVVNGLIEVIAKGPVGDDEKGADGQPLTKKTGPIRLVGDDEAKTGEPQDEESKRLRKVAADADAIAADAKAKLAKRATGTDGADTRDGLSGKQRQVLERADSI